MAYIGKTCILIIWAVYIVREVAMITNILGVEYSVLAFVGILAAFGTATN